MSPAARAALSRLAVSGGARLRDERLRRQITLDELAERAGLGRSTAQRAESGEPVSLETYARLGTALSLRPELLFADPARRDGHALANMDVVHAAMGDLEARQMRQFGFGVAIDEPYQHFQFAGRADVVAWNLDARAMLHIENRTRLPNLQEAAGAYNAKRAYFPAALADRPRLRGGWLSVTHALVVLWSSEVLHAVRLRSATFDALCPDPIDDFETWWRGTPPATAVYSTLVVLDPAADLGRRRRFVGLDAVDRIDPRYRNYAHAAEALSR